MKSSRQNIAEARKVYDLFWDSYLAGDVDTFALTLDDKFEMIGTSEKEVCHSKEEGIEFFKGQIDELIGKVEMRYRHITEVPLSGPVLINEACDIYTLSDSEWNFYSKIRISTLLHQTSAGWKVAHQHGSLPDMRVQEGETLAIDKISKENLELRDAIKRGTSELENKNRELEIEAALERIRARSMAMQNSDELSDVLAILFRQFDILEIKPINAWLSLFDLENNTFTYRATGTSGKRIQKHQVINLDAMDIWQEGLEQWKDGNPEEVLVTFYPPEVMPQLMEVFEETFSAMPEEERFNPDDFPDGGYNVQGYCKFGYIGYNHTREPTEEEKDIVRKFAKEFGRVYQRFLDIQKAEEQAREAQIEAAIERVRSTSLAMHKTEDIEEVVHVFFDQLKNLKVPFLQAWITIFDFTQDDFDTWFSQVDGIYDAPRHFKMPNVFFEGHIECWKSNAPFFYLSLKNDTEIDAFLNACDQATNSDFFSHSRNQLDYNQLELVEARHQYGYMGKSNSAVATIEEEEVLQRFAKVFEQAYTRFLDIQKAEEQAREAQIEAALERVRARSMGMHKSDDLIDVVREIGKGIHELGIQLHYSQIYTDYTHDPKTGLNIWVDVEGRDYLEKFQLPYIDHSITLNYFNALNEGLDYFSDRFSKAEKDSYFKLLFKFSDLKRIPQKRKELILNASGWTRFTVILNEAALNFGRYTLDEFTDEEHEIFIRFAKVFGQAYTRFLDLKKAEEQAREAQIEAALERVRASSLAMHSSNEMQQVVDVLHEQLEALGLEMDIAGMSGVIESQSDYIVWGSHFSEPLMIPYNDDTQLQREYNEAIEKRPRLFSRTFTGKVKKEYINHLISHAEIPADLKKLMIDSKAKTTSIAFSEHSSLQIVRYNDQPYAEDDNELLVRFSKVFEQAYIRFLDLQKVEERAREAEIEAALEAVRSRSLAMHTTDELQDVVKVVAEKIQELGLIVDSGGVIICTYPPDSKDVIHWTYTPEEERSIPYFLPYFESAIWDETWGSKNKGEVEFSKVYTGDDKNSFLQTIFTHPESDYRHLPEDYKQSMLDAESYALSFSWSENTALLVPNIEGLLLPVEHQKILNRFSKVLEQTYVRFLDLEKAEAQAREAQIEASLERVRARSMAMHSSDELTEVLTVLFEQFDILGIHPLFAHLTMFDIENNNFSIRITGREGQRVVVEQHIDLDALPVWKDAFEEWKIMEPRSVNCIFYPQEMLPQTFELLEEIFAALPEGSEMNVEDFPDGAYTVQGHFKYGYLGFNNNEPPTDDQKDIVSRFATEFGRIYQRFLDIKKAEEQAREAQIQLALERVRARSLAMHQSSEMQQVANAIYEQLDELGLHMDAVGMSGQIEAGSDYEVWVGGSEFDLPLQIPYTDSTQVQRDYNAVIESRPELFTQTYSGKIKKEYINFLLDQNEFPEALRMKMTNSEAFSTSISFSQNSSIQIATYSDQPYSDEDNEILKRFSRVFEQAYVRFMDLNTAEKQARLSQIEASLERVRARSMAMQKSDELHDVLSLLFEQFDVLGIRPVNVFLSLFHQEDKTLTYRATGTRGSKTQGQQLVSLDSLEVWQELFEKWKNDTSDSVEVIYYEKEIIPTLFGLFDETFSAMPEDERLTVDHFPEGGYTAHGYTPFGYIGFNHTRPPTEEEKEILTKFASEFSRVYQRFLDIERAEAQARESEIQLALEKVRARSMAMHQSDEITDLLSVLFKQFDILGIKPLFAHLTLFDQDEDLFSFRMTGFDGQRVLVEYIIDVNEMEAWKGAYQQWKAEDENALSCIDYPPEMLPDLFEIMQPIFDALPKGSEMKIEDYPDGIFTTQANCKYGYLGFNHKRRATEEEQEIVVRFAKEFGRAYQRFLDIKQAEAQAKESEIQLALERVRARTMAMHNSEELGEVAAELFEQISLLTNKPERFQIAIAREDEKAFDIWVTDQEGDKVSKQFSFNSDRSPVVAEVFKAWQKKEETLIQDLHGKKLNNWIRYFSEEAGLPLMEDHIKEHRYINSVFFSHGCIGITTNEPIETGTLQLLQRFTKVFQQTYIRFLDLQKAEAQAREAQIEAALERVRAKAMAMHNTGDLANANSVVFDELNSLGISPLRSGIGLLDTETRQGSMYATVKSDLGNNLLLIGQITLAGHHILESIYDHWINKQLYNVELNGQELKQYYEIILASYGDLPKPEFSKKETQHGYFIPFKHGSFYAWTREPFNDVALQTIQRFVSVINLTYNRYFDLQKAEEQAQEARIETALEKVRSRTMAMQSSEELPEVANLMYLEIQELGIPAWSCGYNISAEDKRSATCWMSSEGILQKPFKLRLFGEDSFDEMGEFLRNDQETMLVQELGGKAIQDHYEYMRSFPDLKPAFDNIKNEGLTLPEYQINHLCKFTSGFLLFITYEQVPDSHEIFRRFTNVFDQTYTRFSDLRKAEAQARESDIEAALERVRATSMAMQKTENISDVVSVLFKQLKKLNISFVQSWISVFHLEDDYFDIWFSPVDDIYDDVQYFKMPSALFENTSIKSWREGHTFSYITFKDRAEVLGLVQACDAATNSNYFTHIQKHLQSPRLEFLDANFKYGVVSITDENKPSDEDEEVMLRFAKVFEQTYTRFLDLEKAESLALETQRQSSLDRVRAEIASMRSSEDLQQITPLIWNELKILNIPFIRCGVFIIDEEDQISHTYLSTPQGESIAVLHLPLEGIPLTEKVYSSWSDQQFYSEHWNETDFENWIDNLIKNGFITSKENYKAGSVLDSLDLHFLPFAQGMLYIGNTEPLSEEDVKLGQSLANAFSVAYNRYEDFSKLEQAKERVENALRSLESAQEQLVQQEKLASLGQLTAGIAHEIKNPLNFINNFSDLSIELVDELREEITSVSEINESSQLQDINDILDDLQANLKTIFKHGSRTDMIVKSMLEHSRGGTGEMEPNNINELLREFGNLSYHGMRAGKVPIKVEMEYDLDDSIREIPIVAEDFSRVIVNLCYNGFDAMREKMTGNRRPGTDDEYEPKLTFRTYSKGDKVVIDIEDNGPGIPEEIRDKIMQPFFTTKKGTDGTGLGLSITNDIIKAHGGSMSIATGDGFTRFTIELNK